jgi:maleylacetoacetate isomerase
VRLYAYYRSSAAYRVRIALALKGLSAEIRPVNLAAGEQAGDEFRGRNPQGLVPVLETDDGTCLSQSVAILEWLEETIPEPALYPASALDRARYRALCQHIASDIHPLNNLRVLRYLGGPMSQSKEAIDTWYAHWITLGFSALEGEVAGWGTGFSLGDDPGMFEVMLVPQLYNARRFAVATDAFPALVELDARCATIDAFRTAHPHRQPDTPEELREAS